MGLITTLISGGQTGADRAAMDVALAWGIDVRGWVPRGRVAEDGVIAERYPGLRETASADPAERTRLNIQDADGSLIISHAPLQGGSLLALETALQLPRPVLHLDLSRVGMGEAVTECAEWIRAHRIAVLGVGGPRASEDPHIYDATVMLLSGVLVSLTGDRQTIAD
ncbi:putative molybdenum carrier protein [soil metagenome]